MNKILKDINNFENQIKDLNNKIQYFKGNFSFKDYKQQLQVIAVSTNITWLNETINIAVYESKNAFN